MNLLPVNVSFEEFVRVLPTVSLRNVELFFFEGDPNKQQPVWTASLRVGPWTYRLDDGARTLPQAGDLCSRYLGLLVRQLAFAQRSLESGHTLAAYLTVDGKLDVTEPLYRHESKCLQSTNSK